MNSQPATTTLVRSRSSDEGMVLQSDSIDTQHAIHRDESGLDIQAPAPVPLPEYLQQTYWWAYLHPTAVRLFERQWLVNLILWGNFARLRDLALDEMGTTISGNNLQVACVYGNLTERLAQRLEPTAHLDVVDVAPVQLENLKTKLGGDTPQITLYHQDATHLQFADASYDRVLLFFLLHEQPEDVRAQTIAQAMRVVKPGGKVVFVDYHRPTRINPFRYIMVPILTTLEPFAMDLWRKEIVEWLPEWVHPTTVHKETYFGGLYQKVVITV